MEKGRKIRLEILNWVTDNYFQRMPNGFAKRDDERPKAFQRLFTIYELVDLYEQSKKKIWQTMDV